MLSDQEWTRKFLNRWVFRAGVFGFLIAVFVSELVPGFLMGAFFIAFCLIIVSCFISRKIIAIIAAFCWAFSVGIFVDSSRTVEIQQHQFIVGQNIAFSTRNSLVEGVVSRSIGMSEYGCRYALRDIVVGSGSILGKGVSILADIPCNQKPHMGDRIRLRGQLEKIPLLAGFDYAAYLLLFDIYATIRSDVVTVVRHDTYSFDGMIDTVRQSFLSAIERVFPGESALLLEWLLVGERAGFSAQTKHDMSASGLTHIVAVSGSNIVVFMAFIATILRFVPSRIRFFLVLVTLAGYLCLVGDQVPAQRAGIMGLVSYGAILSARRIHTVHLLLLSAAFFVFLDPKILLSDVSFHLSFLSVIGIIFVSPYLKQALAFLPNIFYIRESLIVTLAAMSFTAPLTWITFGQFSVVAPLSNLMAAPLISPALFFWFFATIAEYISHGLAIGMGFISWIFLASILWAIHFFGSFSFAVILLENESARFWGPGIYFIILLLIFGTMEWRRRRVQG